MGVQITPCKRAIFWVTFVKLFTLCYWTIVLSVLPSVFLLSVCNVGVLWPNSWMDQDEDWHGGRPRPRPHCVTWRPCSPSTKEGGAPQFSSHICCGQMAGWIKMPPGRELGLSPSDIVSDGDPAPLSQKGDEHSNFRPMSIVAKRLDGSKCHLVRR